MYAPHGTNKYDTVQSEYTRVTSAADSDFISIVRTSVSQKKMQNEYRLG